MTANDSDFTQATEAFSSHETGPDLRSELGEPTLRATYSDEAVASGLEVNAADMRQDYPQVVISLVEAYRSQQITRSALAGLVDPDVMDGLLGFRTSDTPQVLNTPSKATGHAPIVRDIDLPGTGGWIDRGALNDPDTFMVRAGIRCTPGELNLGACFLPKVDSIMAMATVTLPMGGDLSWRASGPDAASFTAMIGRWVTLPAGEPMFREDAEIAPQTYRVAANSPRVLQVFFTAETNPAIGEHFATITLSVPELLDRDVPVKASIPRTGVSVTVAPTHLAVSQGGSTAAVITYAGIAPEPIPLFVWLDRVDGTSASQSRIKMSNPSVQIADGATRTATVVVSAADDCVPRDKPYICTVGWSAPDLEQQGTIDIEVSVAARQFVWHPGPMQSGDVHCDDLYVWVSSDGTIGWRARIRDSGEVFGDSYSLWWWFDVDGSRGGAAQGEIGIKDPPQSIGNNFEFNPWLLENWRAVAAAQLHVHLGNQWNFGVGTWEEITNFFKKQGGHLSVSGSWDWGPNGPSGEVGGVSGGSGGG